MRTAQILDEIVICFQLLLDFHQLNRLLMAVAFSFVHFAKRLNNNQKIFTRTKSYDSNIYS